MRLLFESQYHVLAPIMPEFRVDEIKNEPMLFSCDRAFAAKIGGALTRAFIDRMPEGWVDCIIDSRVHMLMPGWFPCIPGWHLDDVPRTRSDGQPDHENPTYCADHLMCIIGDCSKTSFIHGQVELDDVPVGGGVVYEIWHRKIQDMIASGTLDESPCPQNRLVWFDWQTFHRGTAATHGGWRWFIRASRNSKRPIANELRRQVQVYLSAENAGW